MTKKSIEELKKMTSNLPVLYDLIQSKEGKTVQYRTSEGICIGTNLFNNEKIAVQYNRMSKGAILEKHINTKEKEWLIIFSGKLRIKLEPSDKLLLVNKIIDVIELSKFEDLKNKLEEIEPVNIEKIKDAALVPVIVAEEAGCTVEMCVGEYIVFKCTEAYEIEALEDSEMIVIAVPAIKGYANG